MTDQTKEQAVELEDLEVQSPELAEEAETPAVAEVEVEETEAATDNVEVEVEESAEEIVAKESEETPEVETPEADAAEVEVEVVAEESEAEADVTEETTDHGAEVAELASQDPTLTEEFKQNIQAIFEANVAEEVATIEERMEAELAEKIADLEADHAKKLEVLEESVGKFLDHSIEKYLSEDENKVVVENTIMNDNTVGFISDLLSLAETYNINIAPESVDLVKATEESNDELTAKLDEAIAETQSLFASLAESEATVVSLKRAAIVERKANEAGLADTQIEKLTALVESVEVSDMDSFSTVVESTIGSIKANTTNETLTEESDFGIDVISEEEAPTPNEFLKKYLN